jgi:hypothetical protein
VLIHNWQYFLSTVDVYADGAIDAWGFLDRPLFRAKVARGWVVTSAPVGATLSIYGLGACLIAQARWLRTTAEVVAQTASEIRRLNPTGRDLVDFHGSDVEVRGKVSYAKLGLSDKKPVLSTVPMTVGESVPIFRRQGDEFVVEQWFVFADGSSRVGADEPVQALDEALSRLSSGELVTAVPDGARVHIPTLGVIEVASGSWSIDPAERAREACDLVDEAQGKASRIATCIDAFSAYESSPREEARERLRIAYEAVPKHLRMYCGDMDSRDRPIVRVLYGDSED